MYRNHSPTATTSSETGLAGSLEGRLTWGVGNSNVDSDIPLTPAADADYVYGYDAAGPMGLPNYVSQDQERDVFAAGCQFPDDDAPAMDDRGQGQPYGEATPGRALLLGANLYEGRNGMDDMGTDGVMYLYDAYLQYQLAALSLGAGLPDPFREHLGAPVASREPHGSQSYIGQVYGILPHLPVSTAQAAAKYRESSFLCLYPGCTFRALRITDLERHLQTVHFRSTIQPLACDYRCCPRHHEPYILRQDHFRDHLRDNHKEDLPRRGKHEDSAWWSSRAAAAVYGGWWRCNRCLARVTVATNQFLCPMCGTACEKKRQAARAMMPGM